MRSCANALDRLLPFCRLLGLLLLPPASVLFSRKRPLDRVVAAVAGTTDRSFSRENRMAITAAGRAAFALCCCWTDNDASLEVTLCASVAVLRLCCDECCFFLNPKKLRDDRKLLSPPPPPAVLALTMLSRLEVVDILMLLLAG